MNASQTEIAVIYEHGVLRPERELDLPENTRLTIAIRNVEPDAESAAKALELFEQIRNSKEVRLGGWHPTREEMHERG